MMVESGIELQTFQNLLKSHFEKLGKEDNLFRVRTKAKERYHDLGLPTRKHEQYRTVKLRQLYASDYQFALKTEISPADIEAFVLPECVDSLLVFVNGHFCPELTRRKALPDNLVIMSLDDATESYGTLLSNYWTRLLKEEKDPFALVNLALQRSGAFIYAPPKTIVEAPIQILHLIRNSDLSLMVPRLNFFISNHCEMRFVQTQYAATEQPYFCNLGIGMEIGEESHIQFIQDLTNEAKGSHYFEYFRASLKRGSQLKTISFSKGSAGVRQDYGISLCGENCEALLNGLSVLNEKNESHTNILIDHQAPHCRSYQLFKGILNDMSRSSFEGKIMVRQAAQKTEAFQLNNNLLMSDQAQVDSKPNLEIFADDVKASHGATMGQLDKDQLFYMRSRGFSEKQATELLVKGFYQQILDLVELPSLLTKLIHAFTD